MEDIHSSYCATLNLVVGDGVSTVVVNCLWDGPDAEEVRSCAGDACWSVDADACCKLASCGSVCNRVSFDVVGPKVSTGEGLADLDSVCGTVYVFVVD